MRSRAPARKSLHHLQTASMLVSAGAVLAVGGPAAQSAMGATTGVQAAPCPAESVYSMTASQASACGLDAYPVQSESALSDGGTDYVYDVDGNELDYPVPPPGFDPLTASNSELSLFMIPPRPDSSDSSAYAEWVRDWGNVTIATPPSSLIVDTRLTASPANENWSGYVDTSATTFTGALSVWSQPTLGPSACTNSLGFIWDGIGGFNSDRLAQDGTIMTTDASFTNGQGWTEVLPDQPSIVDQNIVAHAGDGFEGKTNWSTNYHGRDAYTFGLHDLSTGAYVPLADYTTTHDTTSDEAIAEDEQFLTSAYPMPNFGGLFFSQVQEIVNSGNWKAMVTAGAINSYWNGHKLTSVGPLSTAQGTSSYNYFTDTYTACD